MDKPRPERPARTVQQTLRMLLAVLAEQTNSDCAVIGWTYTRGNKSYVRFVCNGPPMTGAGLAGTIMEELGEKVVTRRHKADAPESPDTDGLGDPFDHPGEPPEPPTSPP